MARPCCYCRDWIMLSWGLRQRIRSNAIHCAAREDLAAGKALASSMIVVKWPHSAVLNRGQPNELTSWK